MADVWLAESKCFNYFNGSLWSLSRLFLERRVYRLRLWKLPEARSLRLAVTDSAFTVLVS